MRTGVVEIVRGFHLSPPDPGGGHPAKFSVMLEGGQTCLAKAAPAGDLNQLQQARHEVAAWELLKLLDWQDLGATTVLRNLALPGLGVVPAALQTVWPSEMCVHAPEPTQLDDDATFRAAIFDLLIMNSDRGGHNWLGLSDGSGGLRLKLFDHGHCFGLHGNIVGSSFVVKHVGQALVEDHRHAMEALSDSNIGALSPLLAPAQLRDLAERRNHLLVAEALPALASAAA